MNTSIDNKAIALRALCATAVAALAVAGCATVPPSPMGADAARTKLSLLQADTKLAQRAPNEVRDAELAVETAEKPVHSDTALGEHRVYMANAKIDIAAATAAARYAEDQRAGLIREGDQARLDARTREADAAYRDAAIAEQNAAELKLQAAKGEQDAAELRRQIDELQAEATDRGLVLTLGSMLFATGGDTLNTGATGSLDKLVAFLREHPERTARIEGYTDDVGSSSMNQALSERRANSVMAYLVQQGVSSQRLQTAGMGEGNPIADNTTANGRQQNRRVEIIIQNDAATMPVAATD